jgi:hypothetical protein
VGVAGRSGRAARPASRRTGPSWRPGPAPARGPRAVLYLGGAAGLLAAALGTDLELGQVGLAVALVLALVGLLGGREDGPWGAALVLALAGAGVLLADHVPARLSITHDAAAAIGGGAGLLLTGLAEARGVRMGLLATTAAVAALVAIVAARYDVPALVRPGTWAALLFLLGAVNLLLWARDREAGLTGPRA